MASPSATRALAALLLAVASCTTPTDDTIVLPVADVERARELQLGVIPPVVRVTREEYASSAEKSANASTDDELRELRDAYGRLGFFPLTFDPRSTARTTSAFYGAFYSHIDKTITVIDSAERSLLVHELTHALQDQHFDLARLLKTRTSTDQSLAQRALIEGDATLAADRYDLWARGDNPTSLVAEYITPAAARETSDKMLDETTVPLVFIALPSFAYSFGAAYVASLLQVRAGTWRYIAVDDLLRGNGPTSTQEVIRGGVDVDPIVPTGLVSLPADIATDYDVSSVDRIGEYYTYLLLRPAATDLLPSAGLPSVGLPSAGLQQLTAAWDGDQVAVLKKKDGGASGIVWTSAWDSENDATDIERRIVALHAGPGAALSEAHAYTAIDGEPFWVEHEGNQVCFVKNLEQGKMEHLARVALSTREERRMEIVRVVATLPPMVH